MTVRCHCEAAQAAEPISSLGLELLRLGASAFARNDG